MRNLELVGGAVLVAASMLMGCSSEPSAEPRGGAVANPGEDREIAWNLDELPVADRESAKKQERCAVSGESLGMMGAPVKVSVEGRDVWICCDACEEKLKGDPKKYLSKIK